MSKTPREKIVPPTCVRSSADVPVAVTHFSWVRMPVANSYFSGAGLMDIGLRLGGVEIQQRFEIDPVCCATQRLNFTHRQSRGIAPTVPALGGSFRQDLQDRED
jgi:hypothetical protein